MLSDKVREFFSFVGRGTFDIAPFGDRIRPDGAEEYWGRYAGDLAVHVLRQSFSQGLLVVRSVRHTH